MEQNSFAREKLREIVNIHGAEVCRSPRRLKGLLLDYCGSYQAEVRLLVAAAEHGIAEDILGADEIFWRLWSFHRAKFATQLHRLGFSLLGSSWSVDSWAIALGRMPASASEPTQRDNTSKEPESQAWQALESAIGARRFIQASDLLREYQKVARNDEDIDWLRTQIESALRVATELVDEAEQYERTAQLAAAAEKYRQATVHCVDFARAADGQQRVAERRRIKENIRDLLHRKNISGINLWDDNRHLFAGDPEAFHLQARVEELRREVGPFPLVKFDAKSGRDSILLYCQEPSDRYDEVEIVRKAELPSGSSVPGMDSYWRASGKYIADTTAPPGVWYTYRVVSCWNGVRSTIEFTARAARWVPPGSLTANATVDHVDISWTAPSPDAKIRIYRREKSFVSAGKHVYTRTVVDDPVAVVNGQDGRWRDIDVEEGATYFYYVVADFGCGVESDGDQFSVTITQRPSDVDDVVATYRRKGDEDQVVLTWRPTQSNSSIEYVLVRTEGLIPPRTPTDGTTFRSRVRAGCIDNSVTSGCCYSYAVFACVDDLYSPCGAASPPVTILSDVWPLQPREEDGSVTLEWRTPQNVRDVVVHRYNSSPDGQRVCTPVLVSALPEAPGSTTDVKLVNGQKYTYLIQCVYLNEEGAPVLSKGVRVNAVPTALPDPVSHFTSDVVEDGVLCRWVASATDQVVIRRHEKELTFAIGSQVPRTAVSAIGTGVDVSAVGEAMDFAPQVSEPYYSVFTVSGKLAVFGGCRQTVVCPDITGLELEAAIDGVRLRWKWPPECNAVTVVRRQGEWPIGLDDPAAASTRVTRFEYFRAGQEYFDRGVRINQVLHYVVYAQVSGWPSLLHSSGGAADCRGRIHYRGCMTLRYEFVFRRRRIVASKTLFLKWRLEDAIPDFAGFSIVASEQGPPANPSDGFEVFRWSPGTSSAISAQSRNNFSPIKECPWTQYYCKAFLLSTEQANTVTIVHPNVCTLHTNHTTRQTGHFSKSFRHYRFGVPKHVTCPFCFEEFSVDSIKYVTSAGQHVTGRRNVFERLLNRPPRPPKDQDGRFCRYKLCPNGHRLPYNAGTQASVTIGLIGARYAGKSHYITSLIHRLAVDVGQDLQASLLTLTDETQRRYANELYTPLFERLLELDATPSNQPPLIYELKIKGELWKERRDRYVTLLLYDTAGEDLEKEEVVQHLVKYLGVASGILLLIDPLQVPTVRDALPDLSRHQRVHTGSPQDILGRVIPELERRRLVFQSGQVSVPLAVVLTKCDALRQGGLIEQNRLWITNRRHIGGFNRQLHDDMCGMWGELLRKWSKDVYATVTNKFTRHAFFGASATGCASDPASRRFPYVSPWRVEDPLIWLLAELGVVPSIEQLDGEGD